MLTRSSVERLGRLEIYDYLLKGHERENIWKFLLNIQDYSVENYVKLISLGPSPLYSKIKKDTERTFKKDVQFAQKVDENQLIRVLNAFVWKEMRAPVNPQNKLSYVQGMNVYAAVFLYVMPEPDAFYAFSSFSKNFCSLYIQPSLEGVHLGLGHFYKCLEYLSPNLVSHLNNCGITSPELLCFPSIMTFCACTPPLEEALKIFDFLLVHGLYFNIYVVLKQFLILKDSLLSTNSPMKLIRNLPNLKSKILLENIFDLESSVPPEISEDIRNHMEKS